MVEVFKTNVEDPYQAKRILDAIHQTFCTCKANFDLEDCDKVLRIASVEQPISHAILKNIMMANGCLAEPLE